MAHLEWVCNSSSASEKREISEVVQHKGMQMTKGQQQMLNRAAEQTAFMGFVFLCVSHKWGPFLPTSFSISTIPVSMSKGSVRGASAPISARGLCPGTEVGLFCFSAEWGRVSAGLCDSRPFLPHVAGR